MKNLPYLVVAGSMALAAFSCHKDNKPGKSGWGGYGRQYGLTVRPVREE